MIGPGRRAGISLARLLLRPISVAAFAAGTGGLVASAVTWGTGPSDLLPSLAPLFATLLKVGLAFLAASLVSSALMPSTTVLLGDAPGDTAPPRLFLIYLAGLVAIAAIGAPPLLAWWSENSQQAEGLKGHLDDGSGIAAVPIALLFALPLLASAATLTGVLASVLGALTRRSLTARVLGSCVALQIGLVLGLAGLLASLREAARLSIPWIRGQAGPESASISAQAADWFARQDQLGVAVVGGLLWLAGGYAAALAASMFFTTPRAAAPTRETALR